MSKLGIYGGWLTVNRFCNMRCGWCYAMGTKFKKSDDMPLDLAFELVDLMAEIGITHVILIGGETSFWPHTFAVAERLKSMGVESTMVTNGWLLGWERYRDKVAESALTAVNISVKGGTKQQYIDVTRFDGFDRVMEGIRETSGWSHIQVDTSVVANTAVFHNIDKVFQAVFDNGAKFMSISLCGPSFNGGEIDKQFMVPPLEVVAIVAEKYDELHRISDGRFSLEQGLPACIWPPELLKKMEDRDQIFYSCHFKARSGLLFDRWGKVITCNHLWEYPLGQYGVDFTDAESFEVFWNQPAHDEFYGQMMAYPSQACIGCKVWESCGGGCPLNWFVYDPEKIIVTEVHNV